MLLYSDTLRRPDDLELGCTLKHVTYSWKPFEKRDPEHQADYLRLFRDMQDQGRLVNPLIVFRDCVLIGLRRCEIARLLDWSMVPCWEIQTDITDDSQPDRVIELTKLYKKVVY